MKTTFLIILLNVCIFIQAQDAIRLRCMLASISEFNEYTDDFGDFSEPNKTSIVITLTKTKVVIYSEETQSFSIISTTDKLYTKTDNTPYIKMTCVDADGVRCNIYFYMYPEGLVDVLLKYSNIMISYTCKIE